jgi:flagellar motor switch protein FliM
MSDTVSAAPTDAAPAPTAGLPTAVERASPGATVRRGLLALIGDGSSKRPRLPRLNGVIDRLAGALATGFRTIGRGGAEARTDQPRPVRFSEFLETVQPTSLIAVLRIGAWNGHCLAVIDGDLAGIAVGLLLGGRTGATPQATRRGYTAIERAVVERLARDQIAANLANAFAPVTEVAVALDYLANDASEAAIAVPPAPCLTWSVTITVEGCDGSIAFLLPYASIEPIRAQLSRAQGGQGQDVDAAWRAHLQSELPHAGMVLKAVIERRRISATEIMRWRVGSVLPLNRHHEDPIDVFCDHLLVLRARMAEQDGRIALHVEDRRLAEDWPAEASIAQT